MVHRGRALNLLFPEKYEVPLTREFKRKLKDIDRSWTAYLELLATCEVTLLEKKVRYSLGTKENFSKLCNKKIELRRRQR